MAGERVEVGRFELIREVGRGAVATVYLARESKLGRKVALKELSALRSSDSGVAERLVGELRTASSLTHPNIVSVDECFLEEGTPYIAMEYLGWGSLRPFMRRLTAAQIFGVLEAVLAGLARAELDRVVHGDLKPENLMLTTEGAVKIADFGIAGAARRLGGTRSPFASGAAAGTPVYAAPEQALGGDLGPWTDLYSLGVIAYEMIAGRTPFGDRETPIAAILGHINDPVPPLRLLDPRIDPGLAAWVERLLTKDPAERDRSAQEAWDGLEPIAIDSLGSRWRRKARLSGWAGEATPPDPLLPAIFEGSESLHRQGIANFIPLSH